MAFQIKHKPQIVRSARQAFEEGRSIHDYPGDMVPWLKQWQEAYRQLAEASKAQREAA